MCTLKPRSSNFFRRSRLDGWHDKLWAIALLGPVSQDRPGSIVEVGISISMDRVDSSTGPCHSCQIPAIWSAASHSTGTRPHEGTVPGLASAWRWSVFVDKDRLYPPIARRIRSSTESTTSIRWSVHCFVTGLFNRTMEFFSEITRSILTDVLSWISRRKSMSSCTCNYSDLIIL